MTRELLVTLLMAAVPASGAVPQSDALPTNPGPCPEDYPLLRGFVERLLESDRYAWVREELGLANVADEPLRVLGTTREDYPVCAQLFQEVPKGYKVRGKKAPDTVVCYQIGDRYILALTSAPVRAKEPAVPGAPDQFVGYNLELNEVGRVVYP